MGKIIYSMMVSLDGYINAADGSIDWITIDEEIHSFANAQTRELGALLYGRRLYEVMAAFWPTAYKDPSAPGYIVEYSHLWNAIPKYVYSTTLERVEHNSSLARTLTAAEIRSLKDQTKGTLSVGGADLAATCVQLGLVDEYQLFVNPIVLGGGTPYLPALDHRLELTLVDQRRFASGVIYLAYRLRDR